jgi:TPR repeat protein
MPSRLLIFIFIAISSLGCGRPSDSAGVSFAIEDNDLSWAKRKYLLSRAQRGDGEAALRLYYYYDFCTDERTTADHWLHEAARLGEPNAQYTLGALLASQGKRNVSTRMRQGAAQNSEQPVGEKGSAGAGDSVPRAPWDLSRCGRLRV